MLRPESDSGRGIVHHIGDLKRELDAIGGTFKLVPHGQGFRDMSPALDILERLLTSGLW